MEAFNWERYGGVTHTEPHIYHTVEYIWGVYVGMYKNFLLSYFTLVNSKMFPGWHTQL